MRLFYQSSGASAARPAAPTRVLAAILRNAASPGTTVEVHGLGPGMAIADQYRYLEFLDTGEILENGLRAEREGYDAFLIGNVFEPGLHALRELLNIPVLGLCEASVHLACLMGASFSVVNVNPKFARRVTEKHRRLRSVGPPRLDRPDDGRARRPVRPRVRGRNRARGGAIDQFRAAARAGLAKGAETVIPAGGIVMTILADPGSTRSTTRWSSTA